MRIEEWNYKGKIVKVPIIDEEEMEENINDEDELDKTLDLTETLKEVKDAE